MSGTEPIQLKAKDLSEFRIDVLEQQGGLCLICGQVPKRPCLDHSHTKKTKGTGLCRGVICSNCNIMVAKAENNCVRYGFSQGDLPYILRGIADYLQRPPLPYLHPTEAPSIPKLKKSSYNKLKKALSGTEFRCPIMSRSGTLTKALEKAFVQAGILPEFY